MALADSPTGTAIAVKDLAVAREFYSNVLGLGEPSESDAGLEYKSGGTSFLVYPSQFAGTNKATYMGWRVQDVDGAVDELKGKGVSFDTFDMPGTTWEGEIAVMGPWRGAWFKDPDGNILTLGNM